MFETQKMPNTDSNNKKCLKQTKYWEQQMDKPGYKEEEVEDGELWPHGTGLQGSLPGWEKIWNPPFSISAGYETATNQQASNWM